jgi:hypothetical protein
MTNKCYINSFAQISCQSSLSDDWFDAPILYSEKYVRAQEPDTKGLLNPGEARRMSKILKRAAATALSALRESDVDIPDAIITGTGMGCMENSEKFLTDLCKYGENCLKPTLFMQSTHNTISSLIAILLKCHGYNNTYSHKGISFESALFDAWLQIKGGTIGSALVGAHDEVTPFMSNVLRQTHSEYNMISESSLYTVLTNKETENNKCEVADIKLFYKPSIKDIVECLSPEQDDVLMLGVNANNENDTPYNELLQALSYTPSTLHFKNVFGDNFSASAMSFYVGLLILMKQRVPKAFYLNFDADKINKIKNITLINQSEATTWSLIRLKTIKTCGNC